MSQSVDFKVEGVRPEDMGYLRNVGNYGYYKRKVATLRARRCEFCGELDPTVNNVVVQTKLWRAWTNAVAPLIGQLHQLVIAPIRHSEHYHELTPEEFLDQGVIISEIKHQLKLDGYAMFIRSGNPDINSRSVAHTHINLVVADGTQDVRPILGKSRETVATDLKVLQIFRKMVLLEEQGKHPFHDLPLLEQDLVCKRI